jgi:acetyltransferase-like isoleucine patch superfamily enzyme
VGSRSTFLPGSSTDDDVVVAAGSVVHGHLEHGWIYGGVPAKKIKPIPDA